MTGESDRGLPEASSSLRGALVRFVLLSLAGLAVVTGAVTWAGARFAEHEAIHDATLQSTRMARSLASPLVTAASRTGAQVPGGALEEAMLNRVRDGSVRHVVLWDPSGRVIWADDETIVGRVYPLPDEVAALLGSSRVVARHADDADADAASLPGRGQDEQLIEVYVGARGADGRPFVFEAYLPPERVGFQRSSLLWQVLPISVGGLLLFQLLVLPLAFSLARSVDRGRKQRSELISRSLSSWHLERRRLGQDLHDGVIQDLAAVGYTLPAIERALPAGHEGDLARQRSRQVGTTLTGALGALRSLALDLVPTDLDGDGLPRALHDLASRASEAGLTTELVVEDGLALDAEAAGVVYRVTREALRNVEHHAGARQVRVRVLREGSMVLAEVADDGVGLRRPSPTDTSTRDRHFGLQLLRAMLRDVGGTLAVSRRHGGGTMVQARVPADLHL